MCVCVGIYEVERECVTMLCESGTSVLEDRKRGNVKDIRDQTCTPRSVLIPASLICAK